MSCRPHGRILRRSVVVFGFGLLFSVVPLPVLHFETESVGAVEDVPTVTAMTAAHLTGRYELLQDVAPRS